MLKKIFRTHESYIIILLIIFLVAISIINPLFLSLGNIFSILKSSTVLGILSLGVLLVLISGGIDISFPVIAAFSLYITTQLMGKHFPETPMIFIFLFAMMLGGFCGLINGILISFYKLPDLVVTLGTSSMIAGFMYTFIGTRIIHKLPIAMRDFGKSSLFVRVTSNGETIGLPIAIFIFIFLAILMFIFLKYSLVGRSIYALGGDEVSAERAGINARRLRILIYIIVGVIASIAGIIQGSFLRIADPFELYGSELLVIAATVLGGAYIGGGKGSVLGTVVGVLILTIINNSLIILGIPSYWQKVVVGIILLLAVSIPIYVGRKIGR